MCGCTKTAKYIPVDRRVSHLPNKLDQTALFLPAQGRGKVSPILGSKNSIYLCTEYPLAEQQERLQQFNKSYRLERAPLSLLVLSNVGLNTERGCCG